jgi:hypothetical protein
LRRGSANQPARLFADLAPAREWLLVLRREQSSLKQPDWVRP